MRDDEPEADEPGADEPYLLPSEEVDLFSNVILTIFGDFSMFPVLKIQFLYTSLVRGESVDEKRDEKRENR
jgi:hypothetical protein